MMLPPHGRMAAEQALAVAAVELAGLYEIGQGVEQNYAHAATYYFRAAVEGNEQAERAFSDMSRTLPRQEAAKVCFALGWMFQHGKGGEADRFQAADWYSRAAERGDSRTQQALAEMLKTGPDTPHEHSDGPGRPCFREEPAQS